MALCESSAASPLCRGLAQVLASSTASYRNFAAPCPFARALPALLLSVFLSLGVRLVDVHRGTGRVAVGGAQFQFQEGCDYVGLREFRTCEPARLCMLRRCAVVAPVDDARPAASRCAVVWWHVAADSFYRAFADSRSAKLSSYPKSGIAAELLSLLSPTAGDLMPNAMNSCASSRRAYGSKARCMRGLFLVEGPHSGPAIAGRTSQASEVHR